VLPGVRLNLAKTGVSTSVGIPGATFNMRKGKKVFTIGLPGTGFSYRTSAAKKPQAIEPGENIPCLGVPTSAAENAFSLVAKYIVWAFCLLIGLLAVAVLVTHR
jgi:hypothetical protein